MSYSKSEQGQSVVFTTVPEGVPIPFGFMGGMLLPAIIFSFVSWKAVVTVLLLGAFIVWLQMVLPSARKHRKRASFSVSPEGISIGAKQIRRKDIHRVVIRNHVLADDDSSDVVILHQGVVGAQVASGAAAKAKFKRKLAAVSYRVDAEAGGVSHTLGGGLSETTAFAVLSDVSHELGLTVS